MLKCNIYVKVEDIERLGDFVYSHEVINTEHNISWCIGTPVFIDVNGKSEIQYLKGLTNIFINKEDLLVLPLMFDKIEIRNVE